jgi:hypothetical protein
MLKDAYWPLYEGNGTKAWTTMIASAILTLVLRFIRLIHRDAPVLVFPWAFSPRT